jgi:hypothetical protein
MPISRWQWGYGEAEKAARSNLTEKSRQLLQPLEVRDERGVLLLEFSEWEGGANRAEP